MGERGARRTQLASALAGTILLLGGCGSTAQHTGTVADESLSQLGDGGAVAVDSQHSAGRGTPSGAPTGHGGRQAARATGARRVSGAGGEATGPLPTTGPGWDAKHVYVGVTTQKDARAAWETFGLAVDPGDTEAQARAVADDINRRGGVLGRKLKLVFRDHPTLDTAYNPDQAGNATCTYFTQDRPVVAVVSILTVMDVPSWRACLAKAKVTLFSATSESVDDGEASELAPYFFQLVGVSWDPLAPVFVRVLKDHGYFGGWNPRAGQPGPGKPVIGVLVLDTPGGTRQAAVIRRALASAGYNDVYVYQYQFPGNNIQPAVLYFSGNDVTHVISADIELLAFQSNAESQHYRPRYGINTYNAPYNNLESLAPAGQNNGAVGVGWAPTFDVSEANDPGATPGQAACNARLKAGGVKNPGRLAYAFSYAICDGLVLAAQGANAGGRPTGAGIYDGIIRIAPTFRPALGFRNGLSPTKQFVPGSVRPLVWIGECSCFRYKPGEHKL